MCIKLQLAPRARQIDEHPASWRWSVPVRVVMIVCALVLSSCRSAEPERATPTPVRSTAKLDSQQLSLCVAPPDSTGACVLRDQGRPAPVRKSPP